VPVAIFTIFRFKKKKSPQSQMELIPGVIHGKWDDPIETKGMTMDDVSLLKDKVYEIVLNNLKKGYA